MRRGQVTREEARPRGRGAARRDPPPVLADLAAQGLGVFCWCNRCGHNVEMAVAPLIARLGPGLPVPALGRHMRCAGCGGKDVSVRPAWPPRGPISQHLP